MGDDSYFRILLTEFDALEEEIRKLSVSSKDEQAREVAKRMRRLVQQLQPLNGVASAIAPTCPEIGALIWGSLTVVASVSLIDGESSLNILSVSQPSE